MHSDCFQFSYHTLFASFTSPCDRGGEDMEQSRCMCYLRSPALPASLSARTLLVLIATHQELPSPGTLLFACPSLRPSPGPCPDWHWDSQTPGRIKGQRVGKGARSKTGWFRVCTGGAGSWDWGLLPPVLDSAADPLLLRLNSLDSLDT